MDGGDVGRGQLKSWIWAWVEAKLVSSPVLQLSCPWGQPVLSSQGVGPAHLRPAAGESRVILHSLRTSTWVQVAAQTRDCHMVFGSSMGHGHQHRSLLLQGQGPRHGFGQQHRPKPHPGLRWLCRLLPSGCSSPLSLVHTPSLLFHLSTTDCSSQWYPDLGVSCILPSVPWCLVEPLPRPMLCLAHAA